MAALDDLIYFTRPDYNSRGGLLSYDEATKQFNLGVEYRPQITLKIAFISPIAWSFPTSKCQFQIKQNVNLNCFLEIKVK